MRRLVLAFLLTLVAAPLAAAPLPRVAIRTSEGTMVVELETKRAPITATNFLRYVDAKKFDGKTFYRAARAKSDPTRGLIQGGIDSNIRESFFPIQHEPTSKTGLKHLDGTLSMARNAPGSAMGDFFITIGATPPLDARRGYVGYAAFGRVVKGMDVVRRILAKPTWPGGRSYTTLGQSIRQPVKILSARRL
ncbi:peptidylprolyl isomerase [Sphingomonas sp.]|uniref:peptidylprolyl isomerase n=1 Tax=Sphingomonas sp. TaxID=28214 RepID=UPI003B3BD88A